MDKAGVVLWELYIGMNGILLALMVMDGRWRKHPYFTSYIAFRLLRSLVIFPIFVARTMTAYSHAYWYSDPLLLFFSIFAICELTKHKYTVTIAALIVAVIQASLVITKNNAAVSLESGAEWGVAFGASWYIVPKFNQYAIGLFVACFFDPICNQMPLLLHGEAQRFIPLVSLSAASLVWIHWARGLQKWSSRSDILE